MPIEMREVYFKFRVTPVETQSASDASLGDFSIEQSVDRADDAPTETVSLAFGDLKVDYLKDSTSTADGGHAGGGGQGAGKAVFSDMSFSASGTDQDAPVSFFAYDASFLGGVEVAASAGGQLDSSGRILVGSDGGVWKDAGGAGFDVLIADTGYDRDGMDASAPVQRQAMPKMITADYSGTGTASALDHSGGSLVALGDGSAESRAGEASIKMLRTNTGGAVDPAVPAPDSDAFAAELNAADAFDFSAHDASFRGGISVAVGDIDGAGDGTSAAPLGDGSVRVVFRSGTDEPAWGHGGDDVLIGGETAFDALNGSLQIADLTSVAIDPSVFEVGVSGRITSIATDVGDSGWYF